MKTMRLLQLFSLPAAVWAAVVPVHGSVDNLAGQQAISNEDQFFHTPKFDSRLSPLYVLIKPRNNIPILH